MHEALITVDYFWGIRMQDGDGGISNEAATPLQGRKPVGAKLVFTYKTDKNGLLEKYEG